MLTASSFFPSNAGKHTTYISNVCLYVNRVKKREMEGKKKKREKMKHGEEKWKQRVLVLRSFFRFSSYTAMPWPFRMFYIRVNARMDSPEGERTFFTGRNTPLWCDDPSMKGEKFAFLLQKKE